MTRLASTFGAVLVLTVAAPTAVGAAPPRQDDQLPKAGASAIGELRTVSTRRSLGATFVRYRQVVDGLPVIGSDTVLTKAEGRRGDLLVEGARQIRRAPSAGTLSRRQAVDVARDATAVTALRGPIRAQRAILPQRSGSRVVWRVVLPSSQPLGSFEVLVDARSADVLGVRDLLRRAFVESGQGSVFDTNPIVAQGSRGALADAGDADSPALTGLREQVTLSRLDDAVPGCLEGQWAHVTIPSGEVCDNPDRDFSALTRSDDEFEAVMAYFHVDRAQEYVRSLGFTGVRADQQRIRANEVFLDEDDDPLPPDDQDNSFYDPLTGEIALGAGGTDDGEDGEVIAHEYGHAVQDDQVPGWGATDEGGAMGEGFGDYLAAALAATFAPNATFDPCIAEWDELGFGDPAAVPCLRRVDGDPTAADVGPGSDCDAEVHCAGEAWSSALWDIRAQIGATTADRLVVQSHFSLTPTAGFHAGGSALLAADAALYGGVHIPFIRGLLAARGLLDVERLDNAPSGAVPLGLPGTAGGSVAADGDARDLYALSLTAGQGVLLGLSGSGGELDLRLLRPGTVDAADQSALAAAAEAAGPNETLSHTAAQTGVYYVDVTAIVGSGSYTVTAQPDRDSDQRADGSDNCPAAANSDQADRDRDGVGDACDNCPSATNRGQGNWDGDGRGDACDRSARVTLRRVRVKRRSLVLRATLRPDLLGRRDVKLAVTRRHCTPRCAWRTVKPRVRARAAGRGRVQLALRLTAAGNYRLRARLVDRRYAKARSRLLRVSVD